jgi:membrane glycosyltransferase
VVVRENGRAIYCDCPPIGSWKWTVFSKKIYVLQTYRILLALLYHLLNCHFWSALCGHVVPMCDRDASRDWCDTWPAVAIKISRSIIFCLVIYCRTGRLGQK